MGRLDGQAAIVTGGAQGIGGSCARRLADEGAKVLIADIDAATSEANVETIRRQGGVAESIRADLGRHDDIKAMIDRATQLWGRLDILVNNAYSPAHGSGEGSALEVTEEAWDVGMALLVKSIFLAVKYSVPEMRKTGAGSILNISSVHGLLTAPGKLVYEAGKSALIGVTRQMATDFGPMGIRVNAICPGHIVTERLRAGWNENPSGERFFEDQYPLRKLGKAGGHSQRCGVPQFERGGVHHGPCPGSGRRAHDTAPGRLRSAAGQLYARKPGHPTPVLRAQWGCWIGYVSALHRPSYSEEK